ncbi:MAG TPA: IS66 family transposase [Candidatus Paceibacterota bacterium]
MGNRALSKEEIKKRLIRLRNLESLHLSQRFKIWHLRDENRELKKEIKALKLTVSLQQKTIDDLKLQIEALNTMVFGRKKRRDVNDDDSDLTPPQEKTVRASDSYKRPIPKDKEVTETISHPIDLCICKTALTEKQTVIFFEEDIPMPATKIVRKHLVEKGYCPRCNKFTTAIPLLNHKVMLGPNVQKYICYLSVSCRLSFSQIQKVLNDTCKFKVSEGEIVKVLTREAVKLRPLYEQLKTKIRGEPGVHLDETGWKLLIGGDKSYSWVMSGVESGESVFLVGESRGKGNAEKLLGPDYQGFVVSDDYVAYKKLHKHQLCWAHLLRHWRDLVRSGEITEGQRKQCKEEYRTLCLIFADLRENRSMARYDEFAKRLAELAVIKPNDPMKLIRAKTTLRKNIPQYLTCLSDPRIPLTNNQAERSLRHLVLKRKISFGSLTKRTAENLAVLLSVIMSLKHRFQSNFFGEYLRV